MLDKRRIIFFPSYASIVLTFIFLVSGCFSLWFLNGFSKITLGFSDDFLESKYLIVLPENISEPSHSYITSELPINDETTLIDIKNFKFTITHDTCNKVKPFLVILIHSAPGNFQKRNVIRETWGQQAESIATFFLVGFSEKYQIALETENMQYNDLIQGNFLDSYRNMTYKHVMALKWVTYHCTNAKYILKSDDDVFVHISALMDFLKQGLTPWGARRLILCDALSNSKVKRTWRSKWRVSPKEYPGKEYPSYCAGWAILYSFDVVLLLYREAQKEPFFWIDDIHVTGTIAKKINLTQISVRSMILSQNSMNVLLENSNIKRNFFFGPPDLQESKIRELHNIVTKNKTL